MRLKWQSASAARPFGTPTTSLQHRDRERRGPMSRAAAILRPLLLALIATCTFSIVAAGPASAVCDAGTTNNTGSFLAKNPAGFQNSTNPGDVATNEAILESLSGRPAGSVHFVERINNPGTTCTDGAEVDVIANTPRSTGFWQSDSVTPINICFVVVKAGDAQSGGGVAIYQYANQGVMSGSWTTAQLANKDISHIDFYRCDAPTGQTGQITIVKNTVGGDGTFTFAGTSALVSLVSPLTTSGNTGTKGPFTLNTGTYTITEVVPNDFDFTSLQCTGGGINTSPNNATATIGLDAGENVTCTYTNTKKPGSGDTGTIIIKKTTIGGDAVFDFSITPGNPATFSLSNGQMQTYSSVPVGNYTVEETVLPPGWSLKDIDCTDDDPVNKSGNKATVTLDKDETITCTFTNFKEEDDPMDEETKRFIHRRVDNLLTHGPDRARMLRRLQEQAPPSLKDGPLKFSGDQSGGSWSQGSGVFANTGGTIGRESGSVAYNGPNGVQETGLPWVDAVMAKPEEDPFGIASGASSGLTSSSLLSSIASQLLPLVGGQTSFKFGTSLSEIRAKAAEAEAKAQQKKLQEAGLSFAGQPYTNPFVTLRPGLDIWVEGHISRYNDDIGGINREGDFRILYVGADYVLAPGILVGALVQVDDTKEDIDDPDRTGQIEGTGWLVGPYVGVKLLDSLFFDARAAWGQSDNDIWLDDAAAGFRIGSFETERWLATATLTGVHHYGPWRFSPQLGLAYGHESYDTYLNSLGQTVSGGDANIGRLTGGAEVAYRLQTWDGTIVEPMLGITGIWNFDSDDLVINGAVQETDESRAKVEGGVLVRTPNGWGVRAAANYDGIGGGNFESYGGSLWVNIPLNGSH